MNAEHSKYRGKKEYALIYTELITAAKYRGSVPYQEIALCRPDQGFLFWVWHVAA